LLKVGVIYWGRGAGNLYDNNMARFEKYNGAHYKGE
jgi:hypothetical protein